MEIINVEASFYEAMMAKFESFVERAETLCRFNSDKSLQQWLDNQEVCEILGVSKRTLQTYRDNGTLAFSQIGHKMFYRPEDVERVIQKFKYR